MDNLPVKVAILVILLVCLYMFFESDYLNDVMMVQSKVDGNSYLVRNRPDAQRAADTLALLRKRLAEVVDAIYTEYPKDKRARNLKRRFNPEPISASPPGPTYTSYSVNKGEKIVFCLRSKDEREELHEFNMMLFVALHELAHLATDSVGHTEEFWNNFRWILTFALEKGYYKKQNFKANPQTYCGTRISDELV